MRTPRVPSTASPVSSPRFESLLSGRSKGPILCLVTDRGPDPEARLEAIRAALDEGLDWVQVRDRSLDGGSLLAFADALRVACNRVGARLLINRRSDIALACDADGVHLGYDAAPIEAVRRAWRAARGRGDRPILGASTHSVAEGLDAHARGVDYLHLAPVYPPLSKRGERPPLGTEPLEALRERGIKVFAQGGVKVERIPTLIAAGVFGVAVTGTLLGAEDCAAATRALRRALDLGENA